MKRKLLFAALCVVSVLGLRAENAYQSFLTAGKGWTQVSDLSTMNLGDYYFAIVSSDNTDLMVKMGNGKENGNHALWYADAKDPVKDQTYLWTLETNSTQNYVGYSIRNVDYNKRLLQTNEGNPWFCRTNWEQTSTRWTSYAFTLADGKYSIQALANGGTNYLGLWTFSNGYVNNQEIAGNKSGDQIGKFLLYAISKTTASAQAIAAADASASTPYELGYFLWGRANNGDYTGATGVYGPWGDDQNNRVEKYNDNAMPSAGDKVTRTITNAPKGLHEITVIASAAWISGRGSVGTVPPTINDNSTVVTVNGVSKNVPVQLDGSYKPTTLTFNVTTTESNPNIEFKITNNDAAAFWFVWEVTDLFYGDPLAACRDLLDAAVAKAQAYIDGSPTLSSEHLTALQNIVNANDNDDKAFTEESQFNTAIQTIENAVANYKAMVAPYAEFNALKEAANAIANVEYTETTSGSHTTFTDAIPSQVSVADNATTAAAINTAIADLKTAIKTYITGAEPRNEGEYFDITCLMANPDFSDNTITGWTKVSSMNPNTRIQCNEFFGKAAFDFYQTVTGLPNGSYTLSMKAFQRPGGYNEVYEAYAAGTNNATAKVYVNSDESDIMNIMQEMNETRIYTDPNGADAFNSDKQPTGATGFIPNSMEGAAAWFAAGNYQTEVAALVKDGTLRLGFKDDAHFGDVWTLFDEFRLHYYGSSKLIYLKQYLPQLKKEVAADLANGAYANVLTSSEDEALDAALAANPATETEEAYQTAIDNLKAAQTKFRAAATSYDAMVAAKAGAVLTKISGNIGTGVFQYNETTNNTLYSAYETAKNNVDNYTFSTASTAAKAQALVDACNTAVDNYNNQALNAPESGKRYNVTIVEDGKGWNGNAITFIEGGRTDMGGYGIRYLAPANANLNQALKFTAVEGEVNTYKVSAINVADGKERYITTGTTYTEVEGNNNSQIRTTDDAEKASWVKVRALGTDNQFQLLNVSDGNKVIANSGNNDMYTDGSASFTIAEATQASVDVKVAAGKYATRIFPFTPSAIDGITFYSCAGASGSTLTLDKVATPEANKPYILLASKAVNVTLEGWGTAAADSYTDTDGLLTGVYTDANVPVGSYVLQTQNGTQGFYRVDEAASAVPYRAYLTIAGGGEVNVYNFDDTDKIDAVAAENAENAAIYNLAGQRVQKAVKGIYIVSGKKVILK